MATTRTVTGTVLQPDATAYTDWAVKFSLLNEIISDGAVIPKYDVEVTTASDGTFTSTLCVPDTGTAYYRVTFRSGYSYDFNLASGSSIGLNEIISIATVASDPNYITELTSLTITSKTATYAILASDEYIRCNGTFTVPLPATTGSGDVYFIANVGTGTITVAVIGSDTINGTTPEVIYAGSAAWFVDGVTGNWDSY